MGDEAFAIPAVWYLSWLVPIITFVIFYTRYRSNKVKLVDGIWFNLFFYSLLFCLALSILGSNIPWLIYPALIIFAAVLFIIGAIFAIQAVLWIWNGIIMWRRESHTLANTLTLLLGIAIIVVPLVIRIFNPLLPRVVSIYITQFSNILLIYVLMWAYNLLTVSALYQFNRPKFDQDYIIVLGAGLLHGNQVSPLLAARIDRALAFYHKQIQKTGKQATLIFSGGQGPNETTSEGQAMLDYAVEHGLPADQGIAERQSANTYENMRNSKAIIDERSGASAKVIFVTNNYHTYRAARMARQVGLNADGVGAKTSWFFIPAALIREYVAIFLSYKKMHIAFLVFVVLLAGVMTWLTLLS